MRKTYTVISFERHLFAACCCRRLIVRFARASVPQVLPNSFANWLMRSMWWRTTLRWPYAGQS